MKLWLKALCAAFVITVIYSAIPFQASCSSVSNDVFRLHILADSDSGEAQSLKLYVRDRILEYTQPLFERASSKQEAEALVRDNIQSIADRAAAAVRERGYSLPVSAQVTRMYFNSRTYSSYTLPAGMYDALRITIGSGKGHNWWCVMYPSICISSAVDGDKKAKEALSDDEYNVIKSGEVSYRFKIVEIFESVYSYFHGR